MSLTCAVRASPAAVITWYHKDKIAKEDGFINIYSNASNTDILGVTPWKDALSTFTITNVKDYHAGMVQCRAKNVLTNTQTAEAEANTTLIVLCKFE